MEEGVKKELRMAALKEREVKKDRTGMAALCDSREGVSINSALARELKVEGRG